MDATRALAVQHRTIEALFDNLALETRRRPRATAVSRLAEELLAHLIAEEQVFYPAVQRALEPAPAARKTRHEHLALRVGLGRLLETSLGDATFSQRIDALKGSFAQHVRDEEAQVFPRFMSAVPEAQREALGAEILSSRPSVWMVTTAGRAAAPARGEEWASRGRVLARRAP
ncbi:MAG TPA: hemerythrin domain-containing protein [Polyangiaceae bacterium]|jgi:hemerythrin superfamily protein